MRKSYLAAIASGALALALWGAPALAQDAPAAGTLTLESIDPADPFGEIEVDVAGGDVAGMTQGMEEAQNAELKERCQLMIDNASPFTNEDLQFCITLLGRDNEGLTADGLKASAEQMETETSEPAQTGTVTPELDAEVPGTPEGNQ